MARQGYVMMAYTFHASFALSCLLPSKVQQTSWGTGDGRSLEGGGRVRIKYKEQMAFIFRGEKYTD